MMVKTKVQRALILYLETRIVDHAGRVDLRHMNEGDFEQAEAWANAEFIGFGRIVFRDTNQQGTHWVTFTDDAWAAAHCERRNRGDRMLSNRAYQTTAEKRDNTIGTFEVEK